MASTIAAITTGTGGVVTTADASGNLSLLSGTTTIVAVTATGASVTGNLSVSGNATMTSQNSGQLAGLRNRVINGNFNINQRAVSGTVTLTAGSYGHDRFKGGASGCTYTFATSANGNILTISAGTLQQVIEGTNLEGGSFILSWNGTATGRVDSGSYGASGVAGTATAGTNQTVEFGTGTLGRVQYELGTTATTFEQRPIGMELNLSQRYYVGSSNQYYFTVGYDSNYNTINSGGIAWNYQMRTTPSIVISSGGMNGHHGTAPTVREGPTYYGVSLQFSGTAFRSGVTCPAVVAFTLTAEL